MTFSWYCFSDDFVGEVSYLDLGCVNSVTFWTFVISGWDIFLKELTISIVSETCRTYLLPRRDYTSAPTHCTSHTGTYHTQADDFLSEMLWLNCSIIQSPEGPLLQISIQIQTRTDGFVTFHLTASSLRQASPALRDGDKTPVSALFETTSVWMATGNA